MAVRVQPGAQRDAVLAALFAQGVQAVQEVDGAFATSIPGADGADALTCAVLGASPDATVDISPAPVVDWSEKWKASIRAHDLGALVVCPPWLADGQDPDRRIVIEPAMAFGTGEHQTTRGVIRLLQGVIERGDRVVDLGAGSAVLAIAAAKLGARSVIAIEIDHDAIENAEQNVARNGVENVVTVIEGDAAVLLALVAPVRVITANIISSVLLQILPAIGAALSNGGQAILSGILVAERDEMIAALTASGWIIEREDAEDAWWSAVITRA
jgi:ribosomal protein L11 methyltransferase